MVNLPKQELNPQNSPKWYCLSSFPVMEGTSISLRGLPGGWSVQSGQGDGPWEHILLDQVLGR